MAKNPILPGMNPDPSICTDGENYYIATSTFEWFPGIKIYKSDDLVNWKIIARPLRERQINLAGVPDSAGVWAPCLRYYDHQFWLAYSVMHNIDGVYKDLRNYIITADDVNKKWSKPTYVGSQGFDPSIFKDDNEKFYILSQNWDYRRTYTHQAFNGILLQEYNPDSKKIIGDSIKIFKGSAQGGTEGPSLFKKNNFYYLMVSEGGTGRHHAITVARSKKIQGPYVMSPDVTLISSYNDSKINLQKAGHGNIIFTNQGDSFLVHLVSRYLPESNMSVLGRETAIEPVRWQDNWPYIDSNSQQQPLSEVKSLPENKISFDYKTDFTDGLDLGWSSLRQRNFNIKIEERGLLMRGDESLSSNFNQSLITRPWIQHRFKVKTTLVFNPSSYRHQAGLVLYYNTKNWVFLYLSFDELSKRRIINLQISHNGRISEPSTGLYGYLPNDGEVELLFSVVDGCATAKYRYGEDWKNFGSKINVSYLSDEGVEGWGFTGATMGITCVDTELKNHYAMFLNFKIYGDEDK